MQNHGRIAKQVRQSARQNDEQLPHHVAISDTCQSRCSGRDLKIK
jgi:hypothetical protein